MVLIGINFPPSYIFSLFFVFLLLRQGYFVQSIFLIFKISTNRFLYLKKLKVTLISIACHFRYSVKYFLSIFCRNSKRINYVVYSNSSRVIEILKHFARDVDIVVRRKVFTDTWKIKYAEENV